MNTNSVAHSHIQNQSIPSWIDDPFDLKGFNFCQGVTVKSHSEQLREYAQELVATRATYQDDQYYLDLDKLDEDEQSELARLYIEFTNRETNECIYGDDFTLNSEFNCALLRMLKDNSRDNINDFAETVRRNVLVYYKDSLNEVLDEACDDYLHAQMNEQGLYAKQDLESGEIFWGRS